MSIDPKPMVKQFLFLLLLGLFAKGLTAQVGLQLSHIKPSQSYGYVFKPTIGVEASYSFAKIDKQLQIGASVGYFRLNTFRDTFFTYWYTNGIVAPGYDVWENYSVISLGSWVEYKFLDKKISPVIGFDLAFYMTFYEHTNVFEQISETTEKNGRTIAGIPRVGVVYKVLDSVLLSAGIGKSFGRNERQGGENFWKTYVRITYFFDKS